MKVRLLKDVDTTGGQMAAGQIIDHADAGILVLLGIAEHVQPIGFVNSEPAATDNQASGDSQTMSEPQIGPATFGGVGV